MTTRVTRLPVVALALALLAIAGCKRERSPIDEAPATPPVSATAPFRVTGLDLGTAIDAGKRISAPASTFAPADTIYATVSSEGAAPQVSLTARFTYEDGQLVSESTQVIAPTGSAVTEFHVAKASGWPAGKYKVEVTANGALAASKEFEVK